MKKKLLNKKEEEEKLIKRGNQAQALLASREWKEVVIPFLEFNHKRLMTKILTEPIEKVDGYRKQLEGLESLPKTLLSYIEQRNRIIERRKKQKEKESGNK